MQEAQLMQPEVDQPVDAAAEAARREAERDLIRRCQAGDESAFAGLMERYEKKVYWIAYNLVGDQEDARDLSQEAFLRVFRAIGRFKLQYNFYTWLYRIVVNLSIDQLRRKGKQGKVSLDEAPSEPVAVGSPEVDLRNVELGGRIKGVLEALPAKYKTVIVLRDIHELSCEEIAQIIQCTNATTRWRLHKARELFRERWRGVESTGGKV